MTTTAEVVVRIEEIGAAALLENRGGAAGRLGEAHEDGDDSREISLTEEPGWIASLKHIPDHIYVKRLNLFVLILGVAYSDVVIDAYNGYELFEDGQSRYAIAMVSLLFLPNFLTWNFLWANGMTELKHLPIILLQLGPLNGFLSSWETGVIAGDLFWYTASEGLMEATFTGVLTAYLTTFGGNIPSTFFVGVISSYLSISKTAVALNFFFKSNPGIQEKASEFFSRFVEVSLRLSSLACFAYLMKDHVAVDAEVDKRTNTQTAILAWFSLSLSSNVTMITMVEPNCPLSVKMFFGVILIFVSPPEFLNFFKIMRQPFELFRYIETCIMLCLAITPLQVNTRLWDLCEQAPFMVWTFVSAFSLMTAKMIFASLQIFFRHACHANHGYTHLEDDKLERAGKTQETFYEVIASGDLLMTNLFVNLEGARLKDDSVVTLLAHKYLPLACKQLESRGMRSLEDVVQNDFADEKLLKTACESNKGTWHLKDYIDIFKERCTELPAKYLKGGFTAKELAKIFSLQQLKDAGFEVADLKETGCTPLELKNVVFGDSKDMDLQDVKSLHDIGLTWKELKAAGCSAAMLLELGCSEEQLISSCSPPAEEEEAVALWEKEIAFAVESARMKKEEEYERKPEEEQNLIQAVFTADRSLLLTRLQFTEDADSAVTKQEKAVLLESVVRKRDDLVKSIRQVSPKEFGDDHRRMTNMVYLLQGLVLSAKDADRWDADLKIYATPDGEYKAVCRGIFEAWTSRKIASITGKAGTGKTGMTKQVCAELGLKAHVVNCSEQLGRKEIEEFTTFPAGKVLILDEFNRITVQAMEIFLDLLPRIAIPVAFTMNPGYAGRSELPDGIKMRCVNIALPIVGKDAPWRILEGMLCAAGFLSAEVLAEKVYAIFGDCENNLSKQRFYNFGMRSKTAVIAEAASQLKRNSTAEDEAIALQKALLLLGFGMTVDDRKILLNSIQKSFKQPVDTSVLDRKNVDLVSDMLNNRHAVLLVGLAPEDHTKAIRGLQINATAAGAKLTCVPEAGSIYDHSEKSFWELFGNAMAKQRDHATWIIVRLGDGANNLARYIENLNTVLDDNKIYCDESGSRLALKDGRVVFLAGHDALVHASPAFVSRCGVIYARSDRW